jgi:hypothetical protein
LVCAYENGDQAEDPDVSLECHFCLYWQSNIEAINGPIVLQMIRNPAYKPTFRPFKFCPWCGHELHEVANSNAASSAKATR